MKVNVLLFGSLIDKTGISSIVFENIKTSDKLIEELSEKYLILKKTKFAVAVNQTIVKDNVRLNDGDEIALLPPFAGG